MIDSHTLFGIWINFSILMICGVTPFIVWAICSGQFSKFDDASRLPLRSMIVEKKPEMQKPGGQNQTAKSDERKNENVSA